MLLKRLLFSNKYVPICFMSTAVGMSLEYIMSTLSSYLFREVYPSTNKKRQLSDLEDLQKCHFISFLEVPFPWSNSIIFDVFNPVFQEDLVRKALVDFDRENQ